MSIRNTRILVLLAVIAALASGLHFILGYALVLLACLEYLHHTRPAAQDALYSVSNALSVAYLWTILMNRSRSFRLDGTLEWSINLAEHMAFALVICLILLRGAQLMHNWTTRFKLLVVILAFNLIGLGNEWFQNALAGRRLFSLDGEAIKDLLVNACGSVVFLGLWALYNTHSLHRSRTPHR
jgi:hypothetical protein